MSYFCQSRAELLFVLGCHSTFFFFVHASAKHDGVGGLSQTLDNIYLTSSCLKLTNRLFTVSGERNKKLIEYRAWQLKKDSVNGIDIKLRKGLSKCRK